MSQTEDTVVSTETDQTVDNGTVEEPKVDSSNATSEEQDKIDRETYEQLQKELNQTKQELNLRRNKEKELEAEKLKETGQFKELYEKTQAELDEIKTNASRAEKEREASEFRDKVLGEYSDDVQQIAKDLELFWDGPSKEGEEFGFEDAEVQLKAKLDKIAARVGTRQSGEPEDPNYEIHPNNPHVDAGADELTKLSKMDYREMRKVLPVADSR